MGKVLFWVIAIGLSMYYVPQVWYVVMALMFALVLVTLAFALVVFTAKSFGIAIGEWLVLRWVWKHR